MPAGSIAVSKVADSGCEIVLYRVGPGDSCILTSSCLLAALLMRRWPGNRAMHQQLADDLGSMREIVSRLVKQFAERGWVRTGRERIEVADEAALRACADGW